MQFYRIGCILKPHGIQGGLKVEPLTDDALRFRGLTEAYLEHNDTRKLIAIKTIRIGSEAVVLCIEGINTREQAEAIRGAYICVDKANAVRLPSDRYFIADLIGCDVFDTRSKNYGKVTDVLQTGANDVYVVEGECKMLVPALKKVLHLVDTENKRIVLDAELVGEVAVFEN